ncbi:MAG: hypothetical protein OXG25_03675 [Gammaproteobacteria bacterium]|nr:hypothetical protein [Gammaproteobacteria bacterium]
MSSTVYRRLSQTTGRNDGTETIGWHIDDDGHIPNSEGIFHAAMQVRT